MKASPQSSVSKSNLALLRSSAQEWRSNCVTHRLSAPQARSCKHKQQSPPCLKKGLIVQNHMIIVTVNNKVATAPTDHNINILTFALMAAVPCGAVCDFFQSQVSEKISAHMLMCLTVTMATKLFCMNRSFKCVIATSKSCAPHFSKPCGKLPCAFNVFIFCNGCKFINYSCYFAFVLNLKLIMFLLFLAFLFLCNAA